MAEEKEEEGEEFLSRGKAGRQVRRVRADGWTKRRRRIFLAHFAATCNATASARAAGMSEGSAFKLRARDAEFAAQWDAALRDAEARLNGKLIVFAETKGRAPPESADGEPQIAPIEDFDPDLALRLLGHHRSRLAGVRCKAEPRPRRASKAELTQAILKLLAVLKRRRARRASA